MADASHTMAKTAPQSVAQYLPPFSHTGQCATAGRLVSLFCAQFRLPTRPVYWGPRFQFQFQFVYSQPIRIEAEKGRTLGSWDRRVRVRPSLLPKLVLTALHRTKCHPI